MTPQDESYRTIPLTRGYFAIVDAADYEDVSRHKWYARVSSQRGIVNVYATREVWCGARTNRKSLYLHRYLLNLSDQHIDGDHINGNTLDCRRSNLRVTTATGTARNSCKAHSNRSGFKGVYWSKQAGKWIAQITVNYEKVHLGSFFDVKAAARAYDAAAVRYFGEFARPNFN